MSDGNEQVVVSDSGEYRAEIRRRPDGLLQVHLLRSIEEVIDGYGRLAASWREVHTAVSIADENTRAVALARELLRDHGHPASEEAP
jgi:hypothetical protein